MATPTPTASNLTGTWKNNYDKGTYYIRDYTDKSGARRFAWYGSGTHDNTKYDNVAWGEVQGTTIKFFWCDLPMPDAHHQANAEQELTISTDGGVLKLTHSGDVDSGAWFENGEFKPA